MPQSIAQICYASSVFKSPQVRVLGSMRALCLAGHTEVGPNVVAWDSSRLVA